jgi:hypothetical protein
MSEGVRRERLDRHWEETFLDYYGRNALNLHQNRPDGPALAREMKRWLKEHGYTRTELYRTRLAGGG